MWSLDVITQIGIFLKTINALLLTSLEERKLEGFCGLFSPRQCGRKQTDINTFVIQRKWIRNLFYSTLKYNYISVSSKCVVLVILFFVMIFKCIFSTQFLLETESKRKLLSKEVTWLPSSKQQLPSKCFQETMHTSSAEYSSKGQQVYHQHYHILLTIVTVCFSQLLGLFHYHCLSQMSLEK